MISLGRVIAAILDDARGRRRGKDAPPPEALGTTILWWLLGRARRALLGTMRSLDHDAWGAGALARTAVRGS